MYEDSTRTDFLDHINVMLITLDGEYIGSWEFSGCEGAKTEWYIYQKPDGNCIALECREGESGAVRFHEAATEEQIIKELDLLHDCEVEPHRPEQFCHEGSMRPKEWKLLSMWVSHLSRIDTYWELKPYSERVAEMFLRSTE
jgi:hypothetical protein